MKDKKKSKKILSVLSILFKLALGLAGLYLLVAWAGGSFIDKIPPGRVEAAEGITLPPEAETVTAVRQETAMPIDIVGTVASAEIINLGSRLSAYVKSVSASAGDRVKKGQVLITLDDREIRQQLSAAQSELNRAQIEFNRTEKLLKAKAATDQAMTAAKTAFEAAASNVKQIEVMLTYTVIRSPIDGRVTERSVEAGDLAGPGRTLISVYTTSSMQIVVPVPIRLIDKVPLNQKVNVKLDRPDKPFTGTVTEIVGEVDPLSRTQKVKISLDETDAKILPGTFGRVFVTGDPVPMILVPKEAVYAMGQLEFVQVVKDAGKEKRIVNRLIKTGRTIENSVEVLSGLFEGDVILKKPVKWQEDLI